MPTLSAAAFGDDTACWPLPAAATAEDRWLRAVAAGGQGHYGAAHTELAELRRSGGGPWVSLACSTQGSLLRQLGWHRLARGWDGRALSLAGADRQAHVDALVGLAADALGVGRFAVSARLLEAAIAALSAATDPPGRLAVRVSWVSAELAMVMGDGGTAVGHAQRAVELAAAGVSVRHRVKSDVVLAAALCSAGRVDESRALADEGLNATARCGLIPLRWALASLLGGIGSDLLAAHEVAAIRDVAAGIVERRGGHWYRG
jgi:hypothetical protein